MEGGGCTTNTQELYGNILLCYGLSTVEIFVIGRTRDKCLSSIIILGCVFKTSLYQCYLYRDRDIKTLQLECSPLLRYKIPEGVTDRWDSRDRLVVHTGLNCSLIGFSRQTDQAVLVLIANLFLILCCKLNICQVYFGIKPCFN